MSLFIILLMYHTVEFGGTLMRTSFFLSMILFPIVPTFRTIDDQFVEQYHAVFKKKLYKSSVLPVFQVLSGHSKPGKLLEKHINIILQSSPLKFKPATYDCTITIHGYFHPLFGKMMYVYVTCRPDIGYYTITTMFKFPIILSALY